MRYFLCLGSNIGDRAKNLERALVLLEEAGMIIIGRSSLYETQPVDVADQPWFYNRVVEAEGNLSPHELLRMIKKIERRMGRRSAPAKGPRLIDIDILLAGRTVLKTEELVIPHPRLERRNFVLVPLKEISPDIVHPLLRKKVKDLFRKSGDQSVVRKVDGAKHASRKRRKSSR